MLKGQLDLLTARCIGAGRRSVDQARKERLEMSKGSSGRVERGPRPEDGVDVTIVEDLRVVA
jgi:hypothetical protein